MPDPNQHLPPTVSQATLDHFSALKWPQHTLNDPTFTIVPHSRTVTHNGRGHTLTGRTWNTDSTIKDVLSLWRCPPDATRTTGDNATPQAEFRRFYTFGSDLNAHPGLLHGGVIGCVLDSSMGGCVGLALGGEGGGAAVFTAQLNISYRKPVEAPGTVMLRCWVTKTEDGGRKTWAHGVVEGEGGVVYATADGLWVRSVTRKERL